MGDEFKINEKEDMNIVVVGHVDHGKSTIIGRLLADTASLPQGKLEQIKERCRRNAKPFEYAFLLDALKDEQEQGITIDTARCFFKTKKRNYIIIDAPGHGEFLKNMVTGASRAEAALLVIDACEGIRENSKRHGYLLSMLGISQICVLVNKMDLAGYSKEIYNTIVEEYGAFLKRIHVIPTAFIPVSGFEGENIISCSGAMKWYNGPTVLDALENFKVEKLPRDKPFRMPIQGVYKFTEGGDERRIVAGAVETGEIGPEDEVVFFPSGKKSRVKNLEAFNRQGLLRFRAGEAAGFTLTEQIYVKRGEIAVIAGQLKPRVATRIRVTLFWLGKEPLKKHKEYYIKLGTAKVKAVVEEVLRVVDASTLQEFEADSVGKHDVAECIFKLNRAIAFDEAKDIMQTGRFVVVDHYEIAGGGLVQEALEDWQSWVSEKAVIRNYKWEKSEITEEQRMERYRQKPTLVLITGQEDGGKKAVARLLEKRLFDRGHAVYFAGIGNIPYGVDMDTKFTYSDFKEESLRRLGEIAHLMVEAGMVLIVTAAELTMDDLDRIKTGVAPERIKVVWLGNRITTDITWDLHISEPGCTEKAAILIEEMLKQNKIVFAQDK